MSCCAPRAPCASQPQATHATPDAAVMDDAEGVTSAVKKFYGETITSSAELQKAIGCCVAVPPPPHIRQVLAAVPDEVNDKFYGCGSPLPLGIEGLRVLDLGRRARACALLASAVRC
jgi:arsenite methyltransferase